MNRISKELAYFLKKNGAYTKFMKYARNVTTSNVSICSFSWDETDEGAKYWHDLNNGYDAYLVMKLIEHFREQLKSRKIDGYN